MATLVFTCGHCKLQTADHPTFWRGYRDDEDYQMGFASLEVAAQCSHCQRVSVLFYHHFLTPGEHGHPWEDALTSPSERTLADSADGQFPSLFRSIPKGTYDPETYSAWREAEAVYALGRAPTASAMAYRRVVELAVKQLDASAADSSELLGRRIARLRKAGIVSDELSVLMDAAKAFGNEAAHGIGLKGSDAEIARDLCEALLRQCFTVPELLREAKKHMEEHEKKKKVRAARRTMPKA